MTQRTGAPSVTAARVIIYICAGFAALAGLATTGLGVIGLVSGAAVATSSSGTDSAPFASLFGGLIGLFAGYLLIQGIITLAFSGLWFWAATALGRASRAARVVVTVLCGLDIAFGLAVLAIATTERADGSVFLAVLGLIALPALLIVLLWGPASARQFFRPTPLVPLAPAWGPTGWAPPAPQSPPVGIPAVQGEPVTTPMRLPVLCGRCRPALVPGAAFCGGCGTPTTAGRSAGV
jgi:hypothetical protein